MREREREVKGDRGKVQSCDCLFSKKGLLYGPLETQNHVLIAPLRLKKMEDVII
jgi:hypothetical protein